MAAQNISANAMRDHVLTVVARLILEFKPQSHNGAVASPSGGQYAAIRRETSRSSSGGIFRPR
jgi:hypothetical protein